MYSGVATHITNQFKIQGFKAQELGMGVAVISQNITEVEQVLKSFSQGSYKLTQMKNYVMIENK